jgi:hypothetical protein
VSDRKITVTFEGIDSKGEAFAFSRTLDSTLSGSNPLFYGQQVEATARTAVKEIRAAVEAVYGRAPGAPS